MALQGGSRSTADDGKDFEAFRVNADTELFLNGHADHLDTTFEPTFMRSRPRLVLQSDEPLNHVDRHISNTTTNTNVNGNDNANSTSNFELRYRMSCASSTLPPHHCHTDIVRTTTAARNQLIVVACLSLLFMIAEIIGGLVSNSLALITDATHMASDLTGFLVSLFAIYMAKKPPTQTMTFGFYRAEVLGALCSILIIWVVTGVLFYLAVLRVIHPNYTIHSDEMLITAGAGVAFNIIMALILHSGVCACHTPASFGHGHSHGGHPHSGHGDQEGEELQDPSAEVTVKKPAPKHINIQAAFIHVIGDLIQSIGVLIAAYVIKYKPEYKLADPICTFVFSVLVMFTTTVVLRDACLVILEAVPRDLKYNHILDDLCKVAGVVTAHSLHIWSLTIDHNALAVHLTIEEDTNYQDVIQDANSVLRKKYKIEKTTIQVEKYDAQIMQKCDQCLMLKA